MLKWKWRGYPEIYLDRIDDFDFLIQNNAEIEISGKFGRKYFHESPLIFAWWNIARGTLSLITYHEYIHVQHNLLGVPQNKNLEMATIF